MASTFLEYQGQLVQVPETPLICMGHMLFYEAGQNANTPEDVSRLERMSQDWKNRLIGVGCTDLGLDQLLEGDPQKEAEFLTFVNLARKRLEAFGDIIPPQYGDRVIGIREYKGQSLESPWFHKILDIIEALIRNEPISNELGDISEQ